MSTKYYVVRSTALLTLQVPAVDKPSLAKKARAMVLLTHDTPLSGYGELPGLVGKQGARRNLFRDDIVYAEVSVGFNRIEDLDDALSGAAMVSLLSGQYSRVLLLA